MRIQQLLQVVFYVQGAWIFSVHENSAAAASCLLCSMSMYILCTLNIKDNLQQLLNSHVQRIYMLIEHKRQLAAAAEFMLQVVFYVQ
jgi:hypothetical protein